MNGVKGEVWDLFQDYDILCIPFTKATDSLVSPIIRDGSLMKEAISFFPKLYIELSKNLRARTVVLSRFF